MKADMAKFAGGRIIANLALKYAQPVPSDIDREPSCHSPHRSKTFRRVFICLQFENVALYAAILTLGELFHVIVLCADRLY